MLAGLITAALREQLGISPALAGGLVALWVLKDLALYRWLRPAYEVDPRTELEKLTGATTIVQEALHPVGYVRLEGALWRAEARLEEAPIPAGSEVRIRGARGLTLLAARAPEPEAARPSDAAPAPGAPRGRPGGGSARSWR